MAEEKHSELMQDLSKPATPLEYLRLYLTGFSMGAADIVPGVSGGTMAFILGIYETLLNAIKSFNFTAIKMALGLLQPAPTTGEKPTLMGVVDYLHIRFLIPLGLGLLSAIFLLSGLLERWLETQPTYVFAFFAGLIIASVISVGLKVKWSITAIVALLIGGGIAYVITNPQIGTFGDTFGHGPLALFVSGAIAICAMILPGISGSFILYILGQYRFVLSAVNDRDFVSLFFVAAGCAVGIVFFARFLKWLLARYETPTIALLVGFMVGSMRLIIFSMTHYREEVENAAPIFTPIDLTSTQIGIAIAFALIGFLLVSFLDHLQTRNNPVFRIFMGGKSAVPVTES